MNNKSDVLLNGDDLFWHRFLTAQDAGLNREFVIKVANQEMTLEEALGDMDLDEEVAAMMCGDSIVPEEDDEIGDYDDFIPW